MSGLMVTMGYAYAESRFRFALYRFVRPGKVVWTCDGVGVFDLASRTVTVRMALVLYMWDDMKPVFS
jgi:hypothetical protein